MSGGVSGGGGGRTASVILLYHYSRGDSGRDHGHVLLDDRVETVNVVGVIVDGPAATVGLDQAVAALDYVTVAHLLLVLGVTGQRVPNCVCELVLRVGVGEVELGHGGRCGHGQRRGGADQRRGGWERCCGRERCCGQARGRGRECLEWSRYGPRGGRQQWCPERVGGVRRGGEW